MRSIKSAFVLPRLPAVRARAAFYAALVLFAGCGLATHGVPPTDGGSPCATAADCDDTDPCTADACTSEGTCSHTPVANGPAPAASQPRGTCTQLVCTAGVKTTVPDETNVPTSANTCVSSSCAGGKPLMTQLLDGTACMSNGQGGLCANGVCSVKCLSASDCSASANPCSVASCDGAIGMCAYNDVPDGTHTPGVTPTLGNCQATICVEGASTSVADDSNAPANVMGSCSTSSCAGGTLVTVASPQGATCTTQGGKVCDATGSCVQCNSIADCPPAPDACQNPACEGGACMTVFVMAGTPTAMPPPVPGTCSQFVCAGGLDGGVNYVVAVDVTNPPDAGTPCATDSCALDGGVVSTPHPGAMCGVGNMEMCTDMGQCGCMVAADCLPPDNTCAGGVCTCTETVTCQSLGLTCGPGVGHCAALNCNNSTKDGTETDVDCGGATATCATRCAGGKKCKVDGDCASNNCTSEGICCGASTACPACQTCAAGTGACTDVPAGATDPLGTCTTMPMNMCGQTGVCNGAGACADWSNTTACAPASCTGGMYTPVANCNGSGKCSSPAQMPCAPYANCNGSVCANSCTQNSECTGGNACNGGICGTTLGQGATCGADNQCTSGHCVDGFCCNAVCTGQCQACSMAKTGMANGACNNVTAGTPDPSGKCTVSTPASDCGTDGMCTMGGGCEQYGSNTPCTTPTTCAAGAPVTYTACNGGGSCAASSLPSSCDSGFTCFGAGNGTPCVPLETAGEACSADAGCASGDCLGGFCCATSCLTATPCGASSCTDAGACDYPTGACDDGCANGLDGGTMTTGTCNAGTCDTMTMPCTFPYECNASGTACATSCGSTPGAGNAFCATGYYCNGVTPGMCQSQLAQDAGCTASYECENGTCNGGTNCN